MIDSTLDADASTRSSWTIAGIVSGALLIVVGAGFWGYRTQATAWPGSDRATAASAASGGTPSTRRAPTENRNPVAPPEVVEARSPAATGASAPLSWPLWEFRLRQPVPPRNPPLTPVNWRLIGANRSDTGWSIIVLRQGKGQPEYFKVGDSLPGGYQVQAITEEDVTLVKDKRPVILSYIGSR